MSTGRLDLGLRNCLLKNRFEFMDMGNFQIRLPSNATWCDDWIIGLNAHPGGKTEQWSENVGKTFESLTLHRCFISLDLFFPQPKWEIPV
ncbi:hypothetical protein Pan161_19080 [Gimesia algae]|uniref:Uncharacterized protein n=1 Tax=Gimesia algae TaxID=2527971 RepID=A0A517VB85_9PLAN|nr:hypothetical protein Pan161_19080 [Gimesia algae]